MAADKRRWFKLDYDLWSPPGPLKLKWHERKIAIYLRKCSGAHDDGEEVRPDVVLRSVARIAEDNAVSLACTLSALNRLESWPPEQPFIKSRGEFGIELRPAPTKFVRCPVWLWDSPSLPDDVKDVLLFIRSRFTRRAKDDTELFDCNLYGTVQPSVYRCCHLKGRDFGGRRNRLKKLMQLLHRSGLVAIERLATSKAAMVVRVHSDAPPGRLRRSLQGLRSAEQTPIEVHNKAGAKCIAEAPQVHSKGVSSAYTPESFPESKAESVSSNPAPRPEQGWGDKSDLESRLSDVCDSEIKVFRLLNFCCESLGLERGKLGFEQSAYQLRKVLGELSKSERDQLTAADLMSALDSEAWISLEPSLGLRMSKHFRGRLKQELLVALYARRKEAEESWNRSPEGRFRNFLDADGNCGFNQESLESGTPPSDDFGLLFWLIWQRLPHHQKQFRDDGWLLRCGSPSQFLAEEESSALFPEWSRLSSGNGDEL